MTTQQTLAELWRLSHAAYDPNYTQRKIIELLLYYVPKEVQKAVGRIYVNHGDKLMSDKYQIRNTPRAEIKYIEDGIEKSRIEQYVYVNSEYLLAINGSGNQYDETSELINMISPNFISVKWLDIKIVEDDTS